MNLKSYTANPHFNLAEGNTLLGSLVIKQVFPQKFQATSLKLSIWLFGILMLLLPVIANAKEYTDWMPPEGIIVTEGVMMLVDSEDPNVSIGKIEIFDASAKSVLSQNLNCTESRHWININLLSSGYYDVIVTTCEGNSHDGVIMIE